jgi:steroid 5-alpha reductase family enzyme
MKIMTRCIILFVVSYVWVLRLKNHIIDKQDDDYQTYIKYKDVSRKIVRFF